MAHRADSVRRVLIAVSIVRNLPRPDTPLAWVRSMARRCRYAARRVAPGPVDSYNHFAVFSHPTPRASASSAAAVADGANPRTVPRPWVCSHTVLSAARVVVLPVPAGPTSTSTRRPDIAIAVTAST
ncbi:hypothetical protein GALL_464780 [mine drainage metagenome]|uniref:Uncharacterized protein n=1 Tax=mine drainage metagenome TaxID=410659 RepID=A0A1J5Q359_9ZZZZ